MALTPSQRKKIRAKYEEQQKARKNERLGIKTKKTNQKKSKRR